MKRPSTQNITEAFREVRNSYSAAKSSRFKRRPSGVSWMGSGADYHYTGSDYMTMIETARAYDRNDMIIGQGINRLVDNVIQQGFACNPETGDPILDSDLKAMWEDWSQDSDQCDASTTNDFLNMSKLVLRHVIVDGDICGLPLTDGGVQLLEAHRLRTPNNTKKNVVHGVMLDGRRRPQEYWFAKDNIAPNKILTRVSDVARYPARDENGNKRILHILNPQRVSQTRGVTALAPIMDAIGMHDDIQFAKLVQQQIVSCFAIFRSRESDMMPGAPDAVGAVYSDRLNDGTTRTLEGISPGMEILGAPGEKLEGFSPNVPNAEFFDHAKLILTIIAINLGLPLPVLMLDPSNTNFSGWRGAIDQARMGFKKLQQVMVSRWMQPVYAWKLRQWIAKDTGLAVAEAAMGKQFYRNLWSPPYWPYIEPEKDAKGDALIIKERLNSRREVLARRGLDIEAVDKAIIQDNERLIRSAIELAAKINDETESDSVTWRDLLYVNAGASVPAIPTMEPTSNA